MSGKKCSKCGEVKGLEEFYERKTSKDGRRGECKVCGRANARKWTQDHPEKNLERFREWKLSNRNRVRAHQKNWARHNTEYYEKYKQDNRAKLIEYAREYRRKTLVKSREYARIYHKERRRTDPIFALRAVLRGHSRRVKSKFGSKTKAATLLGCTFEQVQTHLILTALKNYGFYVVNGDYHVDHIIPLSSATNEEEAIALCHYTNLQLLTPEDNISKGDRLDWKLRA